MDVGWSWGGGGCVLDGVRGDEVGHGYIGMGGSEDVVVVWVELNVVCRWKRMTYGEE